MEGRFDKVRRASDAACEEAILACKEWEPFNSVHEGYAVILEELDELWEECKRGASDQQLLREEAIHVAAMAIRFIAELTQIE